MLGAAVAQIAPRVWPVDLDMRRPWLHAQPTAAISAKAAIQRNVCSTRSDRVVLSIFMLPPLLRPMR